MTKLRSKIVYFLGAGASSSSEFELPCTKGFFGVDVLHNENYRNLSRFMRDKFPETPCEKINLEEIVTFLELSVDTFGALGEPPRDYIYQARRELEWYVNDRLRIPERKGCQEHKKIIDESIAGFDSTDSIITLNYDLVVDNTLYELSPKQTGAELVPSIVEG